MKNIDIGAEIRAILMTNDNLVDALKQGEVTKIYPIIADSETTFPFLIYRRQSYTPQPTKDYSGEKVNIDIYVCSQRYGESIYIMNMVSNTLNGKETEVIENIEITNMYEDFIYDTYVQYASLEVTLKD